MYKEYEIHSTAEHYSPHDLLPAPPPMSYNPPFGYFYNNVAKHLIKDTVRIMSNGLHINLDRVEALEKVLDTQLEIVINELNNNSLIKEFQKIQHNQLIKEYIEDKKSKLRTIESFIKPFDYKNLVHRSYFMHFFSISQNIPSPAELLPGTFISKWPVNLVKTFAKTRPLLQRFLEGKLKSHPFIDKAILQIATDKAQIYNQKYLDAIKSLDIPIPQFNPGSSLQKQKLFSWLGIESEKISKETGLPSFDRAIIEDINKFTTDENIKHFTQQFIDYSYAAIVRNNFIEAFYKYTVNNRLYGEYTLLGAKTGRFTSSNPNMLNAPSTGSIFAKPIKRCFTAPEGFVVASIDFNSLEDKVIANLTKDVNKITTQVDKELDAHLFHAVVYFRPRFVEILGDLPHRELAIVAKKAMDEGNKEIKELRQVSKKVTFGASYGAYPPKIAQSIKCTLQEAEAVFNNYHNEMYPGITNYRENYVLPTTIENGKIHLGLGFYIKSDNPKRDIRTLNNSTCQFWSILSALTINKLHQLIDDTGLQNDIIITSTIYDSIYFEVRKDPKVIKWLNDTIIPIITQDFMVDQTVKNEADLEIGKDWAGLYKLNHNCSEEEINIILSEIDNEEDQ